MSAEHFQQTLNLKCIFVSQVVSSPGRELLYCRLNIRAEFLHYESTDGVYSGGGDHACVCLC